MQQQPSLTIRRRVEAPPERVFAAWTDPAQIARWWGPRDSCITRHAESDPRVGGRWRIVFTCDGTEEEHDVRGEYREVVPNERLVFTWAWRTAPERESVVTVALRPDGGATVLTLTHEQFADEGARDRHSNGWNGTLDRLAKLFA